MIKIFAKKCFEFRGPNGETFKTVPNSLSNTDFPDWITKDPIFKWAKADGDITVISDKKKEKEIDKQLGDGEAGQKDADPDNKTGEVGE